MKYHIVHKTWYKYVELAPVCHNLVHLAPRTTPFQKCLEYKLDVDPAPDFVICRDDYFGNRTEHFSIEGAHNQLDIVAESVVEVSATAAPDPNDSPTWESCVPKSLNVGANGRAHETREPLLWHYTFLSPHVPVYSELNEYAAPSFLPGRSIVAALADLTDRIHNDFQFDTRATTVDTPLIEVIRLRRGVCQDFAHLAAGCLRAMGLAARYVSGYRRTTPPPGTARLVGADASHAWCSCWCGPLGWIDLDPTSNGFVGDSHVTIAWGRDYGDVCPIQGVFVGGGEHHIGVSVDVAPAR